MQASFVNLLALVLLFPSTLLAASNSVSARHKCNMTNEILYVKVGIFRDVCYFIIRNAGLAAIALAERYPQSYMPMHLRSTASDMCGMYNDATLPIIYSEDEAFFIMDTFEPTDYDPDDQTEVWFEGVLLGITTVLGGKVSLWFCISY